MSDVMQQLKRAVRHVELRAENETLRARIVYLERELAGIKKHCDALTELASRTFV